MQEYPTYYFPMDPPIFLVLVGLFISVTCGFAFSEQLKGLLSAWKVDRQLPIGDLPGGGLRIAYLTMTIGLGIFLGAGMQVFGFPDWLAWAVALPTTVLTAGGFWWQTSRVMQQIQRGTFRVTDFDNFDTFF
jgi:hypothetical protein